MTLRQSKNGTLLVQQVRHPEDSMFENLLSEFTSSPLAQQATEALVAQGFSGDDAQNILNEAIPAATEHFEGQVQSHPEPEVGLFNLFGGHAGRSLLIGITEGLIKGDGFKGALEDGAVSLLASHIGDVVGPRLNIDSGKASMAAAIAAPFIAHYVHEKLAG